MAFCSHCGAELPDAAIFCSRCGTRVASTQQAVYVKPKIPGRGFGISSMVLGIIGLIYAFSMVMSFTSTIDLVDDNFWRVIDVKQTLQSMLPTVIIFSSLPILSLCFAPAAFNRGYKNGISVSGLIMGAIGLFGFAYVAIAILTY